MSRTPVADQIFGHNKAPIDEVLKADFADLTKEVEGLCAEAGKAPKRIRNEDDLGTIGNFFADLRALKGRIEGIRKDEGEPMLSAKRALDGFFKDLAAELEKVGDDLQATADEYTRRKAAEERARREEEARKAREREERERQKAEAGNIKAAGRAEQYEAQAEAAEKAAIAGAADLTRTRAGGVTSSAKTVWDFRIDDYTALQSSLGPLGPFIDRKDVEKAIRSVVRIQKGNTSLPGVAVFEDVKSTFRR